MIGVVVPVHNEEDCLDACLMALSQAACHPGLGGESVEIVVVLDDCADGSASIAGRHPVSACLVAARNVGLARREGAAVLLQRGARWLAFTDADTVVTPAWLVHQLALRADAVCGVVSVDDWGEHAIGVAARFASRYEDCDGHRHVHGANLGVCALAYQRAGGFAADRAHEDVALVARLAESGARIAWSALPRVVTSARRRARVSGGFADYLVALASPTLAA